MIDDLSISNTSLEEIFIQLTNPDTETMRRATIKSLKNFDSDMADE